MKKIMANKDFKYSIYSLWDGEVINWLVFRQEMIRYFGHTNDNAKMSKEEAGYVARWGKRFKERRDRERLSKLD